jgi:hypothetical protein
MKPMEAWHIISANLSQYYSFRMATTYGDKGCTDAEIEAEVICFKALQEMEKRGADNE